MVAVTDLYISERILLIAYCILALFQLYCRFFRVRTHFFEFGPVFGCHAPLLEKSQLHILKVHFMQNILKKKIFKNLQE